MITVSEFCKGLQQLKGAARAIDMVPQLGLCLVVEFYHFSGSWSHDFQLADRSVPIMSLSCTLILCVALEQFLTCLTNMNHEQKNMKQTTATGVIII